MKKRCLTDEVRPWWAQPPLKPPNVGQTPADEPAILFEAVLVQQWFFNVNGQTSAQLNCPVFKEAGWDAKLTWTLRYATCRP